MADYYPLLVRAMSGLSQNTGETRKAVYDRARAALLKQLRGVEPPLPEGEILRQRQALEEAIRRVEAEQPVEPPAPAEPETAETPSGDAGPAAPSSGKPETGKADPSAADSARTDPARVDPAKPDLSRPDLPKPVLPKADLTRSRTIPPAADASGDTPPSPAATAAADEASDLEADDPTQTRPSLGRGKVGERHERPRLPADRGEAGRPRWQRAAIAVGLIAILLAGGAYAVVNRETLFGSLPRPAAPQTTGQPADAAKPEPTKSADRVAQSGEAPAQRAAPPAPRQGTTSQRAYLFEEAAGGAQGLQTYEGTVTWRTETFNAGPGLPPDVGIRADVQIPGRLSAVFTLRRNADAALPASHTLEITFSLPPDFAYGGVSNVPGIRMKQTESAQGAPLAGLSVRVNPTYFLVGLSAVPSDKERNLQLLQSRPWIDIPVVYSNNKRAILAFEKGPAGTQAFQDAFSAWGELLPPAPPPMPLPPAAGAN